jgi:polyhydroxyalkanoic acid synthase PhaR subunit
MPNEAKTQNALNLLEFWRQWNEATTSMWANSLNSMNDDRVAGMDSPMNNANTGPGHTTNKAQALLDSQVWKLWLDMAMNIWRSGVNMGGDPLRAIVGWMKTLEQVQERASSDEPLSFDFFALFHEWYKATSTPWSKLVEDLIGSERFLAFTDPFLESYSNLIKTSRDASEIYFKALRLPTHSDLTAIAELIIGLEEKVDNLEEVIERAKDPTTPGAAPMVKTADIELRLNHIETELDRILALLERGRAVPTENFSNVPESGNQ